MSEITTIAKEIVAALNELTPLGFAAGLAFIIYQLVAKKGSVRTISENHLSGMPDMQATLTRIETELKEANDQHRYANEQHGKMLEELSYWRGRFNGGRDK